MSRYAVIDQIAGRLSAKLPGAHAHVKMAASPHFDPHSQVPEDASIASVLILLFYKDARMHTVLIKRAVHPKDKHSGQISLPGGKFEQKDVNIVNTAIRECAEEVGIFLTQQDVLGALSPIYIPISNFLIHPYIAFFVGAPNFRPERAEVQEIIAFPLAELFDPVARCKGHFDFLTPFHYDNIPYFAIRSNVVWGATAMILQEFVDCFAAFKQQFC